MEIKNLYKKYDKHEVFHDFSVMISEKKTTAIMGPSGVGKTTLLRLIAGLEKADAGEITGVPERLSYVFQEDRLADHISAVKNVRIAAGKSVSEEQIREILSELGLEGSEELPVRELSGGMKRRAAIARALLADHELLLMDEPLQGLDEVTRQQTIRVIRDMTRGETVIIVTHDEYEAEQLAEEVLLLPDEKTIRAVSKALQMSSTADPLPREYRRNL